MTEQGVSAEIKISIPGPVPEVAAAPLPPKPLPVVKPPKKALSDRQIEEVVFWTPQLKEHALFLYLGLEPVPVVVTSPLLDKTASAIQVSTQVQQQTTEQADLIRRIKDRARQVYVSWGLFEKQVVAGKIDVAILCNLVNHLRYLKNRVMDLQMQKVWVGALYPEFVSHIRDELDYFVRRFNNTISADEEKLFWTHINADHAAFAAHMINTDYASRPTVAQALTLADEGHAALAPLNDKPVDLLQMAELSRRFDHSGFATRVDRFHMDAWNGGDIKVVSTIHPVMLAHVTREGQRSLVRLAALGALPSQSAGQAAAYQQLAAAVRAAGYDFVNQ